MRMTFLTNEEETIKFAKMAANDFEKNPQHMSFTLGEIEPGCLFALRYGLGDDCVLVFKLDESFEPVNFQNLVQKDRPNVCRKQKYATQGRYLSEDESVRLIALAIRNTERGSRDWEELTGIVDKFGNRASR